MSEGLRSVREGRGARLASLQQQVDGSRNKDQASTSIRCVLMLAHASVYICAAA